ncbi:hypothetical protein D3C81_793520 [compost metagenome]
MIDSTAFGPTPLIELNPALIVSFFSTVNVNLLLFTCGGRILISNLRASAMKESASSRLPFNMVV